MRVRFDGLVWRHRAYDKSIGNLGQADLCGYAQECLPEVALHLRSQSQRAGSI